MFFVRHTILLSETTGSLIESMTDKGLILRHLDHLERAVPSVNISWGFSSVRVDDFIWIYNQATKGDLRSKYNKDCILHWKRLYFSRMDCTNRILRPVDLKRCIWKCYLHLQKGSDDFPLKCCFKWRRSQLKSSERNSRKTGCRFHLPILGTAMKKWHFRVEIGNEKLSGWWALFPTNPLKCRVGRYFPRAGGFLHPFAVDNSYARQ